MTKVVGFVLPAAALAFGSLSFKAKRGFLPAGENQILITAQVTIEERHHDELEITNHPVEHGAEITDHAYKRPPELFIECAWSNSPSRDTGIIGTAVGVATAVTGQLGALAAAAQPTIQAVDSILSGNNVNQAKAVYNKLLLLQASRQVFQVFTGKREYVNMLFQSLDTTTDVDSENILSIKCRLVQILVARTQVIVVPINTKAQASPQKTTPTLNKGQSKLIKK
jgi:hypothetical protein